jgi:hypothetical protein
METTYNDFPAEKFSAEQTHDLTSQIIDWQKSHTLAEAHAVVARLGRLNRTQQTAPMGFYFVLFTNLGYFPHHLEPFKPNPTPSVRLARRFDNILLVLAHAEFWKNYLDNVTITIRLIPSH